MKIQTAIPLLAAALSLLGAGCASESVTWSRYPTTSFAEMSLPRNAAVRIESSEEEPAREFAALLRSSLADSGEMRIVGQTEEATHLIYIQGASAFRSDTPEQARYMGNISVETLESDGGGSIQRIKRERGATHVSAREISVAVYATKTLTPMLYLFFPIFDGGSLEGGAQSDAAAAEQNRSRQERFAKLAAARMKEIFTTQGATIKVPVPVEANTGLKVQFALLGSAVDAKNQTMIEKALAAIDLLARDRAVIPGPLEEFAADSAASGWEPPEGTTREMLLGNYYLVALRREIGCMDPDGLSSLHAEMLRILELSEDPSLRMACPIALQRLERKLAHLRAM